MLYFDHNATHPLSGTAKRAWLEAVEQFPGNPSSPHRMGQRAEAALQNARERLARILGCGADQIVFTSGATESANAVIAQFDEFLASAIEHPCVLEPLRGRSARFLPSAATGVIELPQFDGKKPQLVALMAANNETGVLQPWREALAVCRENGVPIFCDAVQWVGRLPAAGLGECDFVSGCAHKFGGPQGVGFLKCPADFPPLLRGGPQEEGRRAGTENVAGVLAMLAALEEREAAIRDGALDERLAWRAEFRSGLRRGVAGCARARRRRGAALEHGFGDSAGDAGLPPPLGGGDGQAWFRRFDGIGVREREGKAIACADGDGRGAGRCRAGAAIQCRVGTTRDDWGALLEGVKAAAREMGVR